MSESSFVGYVGEADFHDGSILAVEQQDGKICVRIQGASGQIFLVEFTGVCAVRANRPEGMILYALSEMTCQAPIRRFVFANWDDQSQAQLEIDAQGFSVQPE